MNYSILQKLQNRLCFTVDELAAAARIRPESARVLASRYAQKGIFIRLKNNLYVLGQKWQNLAQGDFLAIANRLQVPSYVSFMTALMFYEVTSQVQRGFVESASLKRSISFDARDTSFNFYKLKKAYYFGFSRQDNIFIASKEKAFVDMVYLYGLGKYRFDASSLDLKKLDKNLIKDILKTFPAKTGEIARKLCRI